MSPATKRIEQNLANLHNQQQRSQQMFNQHRNALATTAIAAYALAQAVKAPIQAATDYENGLFQIGLKADLDREKVAALGEEILKLGRMTGQGAQNQVSVVDQLMGKGLDEGVSVAAAEQIGYAASAYEAAGSDLANAVGALLLNGGITQEQIGLALDIMTKSGKLGQVEITSMAAEFPALTAAGQELGMGGVEGLINMVSWLQIAREGTASASEAATNLSDFMMKIQMPDVQDKFSKVGVDLKSELAEAKKNGVDPIEHVLGIIQGLQAKGIGISDLFGEKNSLMFLQTALPKIEKVLAWQEELQNSEGTVAADFEKWKETPAGSFADFFSAVENLNIVLGQQLIPELQKFTKSVTPMIDGVADFTKANGRLVAAVIEVTAALIGLRMLASLGGMVKAFFGMSAATAAIAAGGGGGAAAGAAGGALATAGSWLTKLVGAAVASAPAALSELTIGGPNSMEEYDAQVANQGEIKQRMWDMINGLLASDDVVAAPARDMGLVMEDLRHEIALVKAEIAAIPPPAFDGAMDTAAPLRTNLARLEAELAIAGADAGQSLSDGFAGQIPGMATEMQSVMARLRIIAASGVTIPMRTIGPQASPVVTRASIAGARASGGPVRGGSTYEINELGTEYFTPGSNGFIHKAGSFQPPSHPAMGGRGSGPANVTNSIGDIIVNLQNPTNADPATISRMLGEEVGKRMRGSFSNGGYQ